MQLEEVEVLEGVVGVGRTLNITSRLAYSRSTFFSNLDFMMSPAQPTFQATLKDLT